MYIYSRIGEGISGAIRYAMGEGKDDDGKPKPRPGGAAGAIFVGRAEVLEGFNLGFTLDEAHSLGVSDQQYVEFARSQMEWNGRTDVQGPKRKYCAQDCLHTSLSWAPGEKPTKQQMIQAARDFLAAIGMATAQAIIIEHLDRKIDRKGRPRATHVHIVASRLDPATGRVYPDNYRGLRERHFATVYEERMHHVHGWAIPEGTQWRHNQRAITRDIPDYEDLFDNLFRNKSVITVYGINLALAFGGHFGREAAEHHQKFVAHHKLIPLANYPGGPTAAYTTDEILRRERKVRRLAKKLHAQTGFEVPDFILDIVADKFTLDAEQRVSLRHLTRDNGFAIQTGNAGTGKSHVICKAVRLAYEMMGRTYGGTAFTNNNVIDMRRESLQNAHTLDTLLMKWKFEKVDLPNNIFPRGSVIAVEEAGQTNISHYDRLFSQAERRGIKIILSGDDKQMSPVVGGTMFPIFARKFGTSVLTTVRRHPGKQKEWDAMAEGVAARSQKQKQAKWQMAIKGFKARGEIHFFDTEDEAIEGIAAQYERDRAEHPERSQLILGHTNKQVKALNEAVIKLQTESGKRGAETIVETTRGPIGYAIGDRIMLRDNHPDPKIRAKGYANGAIGTLTGIEITLDGRKSLKLDMDRPPGAQKRVFEVIAGIDKDNGQTDTYRGIAGTNFLGQGKSIDHVYPLFDPRANSNSQLVAMSRDKKEVYLAVPRETAHGYTNGYEGLATQMSEGGAKRAASSYYPVETPAPEALEPPTPAPQLPPSPSPPLAPEPEPSPNRTPEPAMLPSPAPENATPNLTESAEPVPPSTSLTPNEEGPRASEPEVSEMPALPVSKPTEAPAPPVPTPVTSPEIPHAPAPLPISDVPVPAAVPVALPEAPAPENVPAPSQTISAAEPTPLPYYPGGDVPIESRPHSDPVPSTAPPQEMPVPEVDDDQVAWPFDPQEEHFRKQQGWPGSNNGWPGIRPGVRGGGAVDGPEHGPDETNVGTGNLPDHTEATRPAQSLSQMIQGFIGDRSPAPGVDPFWHKPRIEIRGDEPLPEPATPTTPIQPQPPPLPIDTTANEVPQALPPPKPYDNPFNMPGPSAPEPPDGPPQPQLPPPGPEPDPGYGL